MLPFNLAAKLLPASGFFNLSVLLNVHLHAWVQQHFAQTGSVPGFKIPKLNRQAVLRLVDYLKMIFHQTIANNMPWERVAAFFARLGRWLIVEFIPKSDPQVRH